MISRKIQNHEGIIIEIFINNIDRVNNMSRGDEYLNKCFDEVMRCFGKAFLDVASLGICPFIRYINSRKEKKQKDNHWAERLSYYIKEHEQELRDKYLHRYLALNSHGMIVGDGDDKSALKKWVKKEYGRFNSVAISSLDGIIEVF